MNMRKKNKVSPGKLAIGYVIIIGLLTISLTAFAAAESEPNNSISTADVISSSGDVVTGTLNEYSDDEDYYQIYLNQGSSIYINLIGTGDDFDLRLYNTYENSVESSSGGSSIESISYTASRSGYHYIEVDAFSGSGSYTLTVTVDGLIGPTGISAWIWVAVIIIIVVVVIIVILAVVISKKPPTVYPPPQQQWQQPQYQQPPPQQAPPPQQPPPQQPPPGNP
jgi:hypothetical protein